MKIGQKHGFVFALLSFWIGSSVAASPVDPFEVLFENSSEVPTFQLVDSAHKSLDIEIYQISDLVIQSKILEALKRGVKVRIIQESETVGSRCPVFEPLETQDSFSCRLEKSFVQDIQKAGGEYVPYRSDVFCPPGGRYRCLQHGKMLLADGKKVMLSTGNFNPTNLCNPEGTSQGELSTCNRDFSVISTDPQVIYLLNEIFEQDFKGAAYDLLSILARPEARKITVSPHSLNPILSFIASAKSSIEIENQYLRNAEMNQALIEAARRGVKIRLLVNSICIFNRPDPVRDADAIKQWTRTFTAFDQAGIQSRNFTRKIQIAGRSGYLHSKVIVVDQKRAWVGSVNGSTQALTQNREFGIFIDDLSQVQKLRKIVLSDFQEPNTESWKESLNCAKD